MEQIPPAPPEAYDQQSEPTHLNQLRDPNRKAALCRQAPTTMILGSRSCPRAPRIMGLQKPKKTQGAPGARNGQFAKENVIETQHFGDRLQKLGFWARQERPEAQGDPGDRMGLFAKENVKEKQHFGDRLPKLGFWRLQEPKKAQGAPGARNGQFAN